MLSIAKFLSAFLLFSIVLSLNTPIIQAQISNSTVLFDDNFSNNLDKWRIKFGNWYIDQNALVNKEYGVIDKPSRIETGEENWENFRLEVDLNNLDGIDSGIGFRRNNANNSNYELTIRHGSGESGPGELSTPQILLQKVYWNQPYISIKSTKILGDNRSFPLLRNKWYHIRIEVFKKNIKVWVDDNNLFDITDDNDDIKFGFITLASWTGKLGKIYIAFKDVKVTSLTPIPFLDLPWGYTEKGLSFNEAALAINSFFDHQYPLLSRGLDLPEAATVSANIVNFMGQTTTDPYSKHDGYDWGNKAKAKLGDPVLAAASGTATYINSCSSCGNMIVVDHGNNYQTRYMHLQEDDLITDTPNQPTPVSNRQQIGKVGFSGNVEPKGEKGAHIHFGVFQDKDGDGNFNDNEPDGVTDPFGWQSQNPDQWEVYSFFYLEQNRTGNKSYYLWKNNLANMASFVTPGGSSLNVGNYTLTFPPNSTNKNIIVNAKSTPLVQPSNNLTSLGSTLLIKANDTAGGPVTNLQYPFNILLDFSSLDGSKIKSSTLSFYSSPDGISWTKENTSFPTTTKAQTQIDHLSYFALIGERVDTTTPTTTTILSGMAGQPAWFRSDVNLTLNAVDNEGGLGVDYTLYRINEGVMQLFSSPLSFANEGHYKVDFYSVDEDENTEEVKTIEFDIDKTPPQLSLDSSIHTIWPPNGKMVPVNIIGTSNDDNLYQTEISIDDEYNQIEPTLMITGSDLSQTIQLEARRKGDDPDGRIYTIEANATDLAGNTTSEQTQILVPHDQSKN